jgi:hypothetical protein
MLCRIKFKNYPKKFFLCFKFSDVIILLSLLFSNFPYIKNKAADAKLKILRCINCSHRATSTILIVNICTADFRWHSRALHAKKVSVCIKC